MRGICVAWPNIRMATMTRVFDTRIIKVVQLMVLLKAKAALQEALKMEPDHSISRVLLKRVRDLERKKVEGNDAFKVGCIITKNRGSNSLCIRLEILPKLAKSMARHSKLTPPMPTSTPNCTRIERWRKASSARQRRLWKTTARPSSWTRNTPRRTNVAPNSTSRQKSTRRPSTTIPRPRSLSPKAEVFFFPFKFFLFSVDSLLIKYSRNSGPVAKGRTGAEEVTAKGLV